MCKRMEHSTSLRRFGAITMQLLMFFNFLTNMSVNKSPSFICKKEIKKLTYNEIMSTQMMLA